MPLTSAATVTVVSVSRASATRWRRGCRRSAGTAQVGETLAADHLEGIMDDVDGMNQCDVHVSVDVRWDVDPRDAMAATYDGDKLTDEWHRHHGPGDLHR